MSRIISFLCFSSPNETVSNKFGIRGVELGVISSTLLFPVVSVRKRTQKRCGDCILFYLILRSWRTFLVDKTIAPHRNCYIVPLLRWHGYRQPTQVLLLISSSREIQTAKFEYRR